MKKMVDAIIQTSFGKMPAKIWFEPRRNIRASIGKTAAILRMPYMIGKKDYQDKYAWFENWVEKQLHENQVLKNHFFQEGYQDGQAFEILDRTFTLSITKVENLTSRARVRNGVIEMTVSDSLPLVEETKAMRVLLSRVMGKIFLPEITTRVNALNKKHFQKPVRGVRLKYTHSRWGSCSSAGNINLSTRLLMAPRIVIDYVIIHELAHLVEANHSPRFWEEVTRVMPAYKEHEQWLKENGHLCDF